MKTLVLRNLLFREFVDFRRDVDQMFNHFLHWRPPQEEQSVTEGFIPAVETYLDKDRKNFRCQVVPPGVDLKDVNIQLLGNTLTISGERLSTDDGKESDYLHREISYGSLQRLIELPDGVDRDKLMAEYHNGILEIAAPISVAALPRKIEVKTPDRRSRRGVPHSGDTPDLPLRSTHEID